MPSPLILLDVDGVLNPQYPEGDGWRIREVMRQGAPWRVVLNDEHGKLLRDLAHATGADLAWASPWGYEANRVGRRLGVPSLPSVRLAGSEATGVHPCTPAVAPYAEGRPFVWLSAALERADTQHLRAEHGPHFKLVHVTPVQGLLARHLDIAAAWLAARATPTLKES